MIRLNNFEKLIQIKYNKLKDASGTHSPSIQTVKSEINDIKIIIDGCFLSNPYATDLFMEFFDKDLIQNKNLRSILEFYPSQNSAIANILSKKLDIEKEHILIGNGAIEIIQALIHNYIENNIVICTPTFSSYYEFVKPGTQVLYYKLKKEQNFKLNEKEYLNFLKKNKAKNIVLINPNNPDGGYIKQCAIENLLHELKFLDNIIIDESFIHFASEDNNQKLISHIPFFRKFPNVSIVKSMSKDFGIAGVRCGFGIINNKKIIDLLKNGYLWNSNGISEYFFTLFNNDKFYNRYETLRKIYNNEVRVFIKELCKISNIKVYPSNANFVLIELIDGSKAENFVMKMYVKYGIYLRNCDDKIGLNGEFIRIASRSKSENQQIIGAIKEIFEC